jgi:hypothetical protein
MLLSSSHAYNLRRPLSTHFHNTQAPAILRRLPSLHARSPQKPAIFTPHNPYTPAILTHSTYWNPASAKLLPPRQISGTYNFQTRCLRIGMEDDILHFLEGVHEDDVVGTGLNGIVAIQEDRKTATSVSNRIWQCRISREISCTSACLPPRTPLFR